MLMTVPEAAQLLGRPARTLYRYARQGQLPGVRRFGRTVLVYRPELEAWLTSGQEEAAK